MFDSFVWFFMLALLVLVIRLLQSCGSLSDDVERSVVGRSRLAWVGIALQADDVVE